MHCFEHRGAQALGICKSCGRGVCDQCAKVSPLALACSQACSDRLASMERLVGRSQMLIGVSSSAYTWIGLLFMLLGLLVGGLTQMNLFARHKLPLWLLAGFCLVAGVATLFGSRAVRRGADGAR